MQILDLRSMTAATIVLCKIAMRFNTQPNIIAASSGLGIGFVMRHLPASRMTDYLNVSRLEKDVNRIVVNVRSAAVCWPEQSCTAMEIAMLRSPVFFVAAALLVTACVSSENETGVDNIWRKNSVAFVNGRTKESDVLSVLGPPSQILSMRRRTVFYYLRQKTSGNQKYFIIYNSEKKKTIFDRAIFFFDKNGVLLTHAFSKEALGPSGKK